MGRQRRWGVAGSIVPRSVLERNGQAGAARLVSVRNMRTGKPRPGAFRFKVGSLEGLFSHSFKGAFYFLLDNQQHKVNYSHQ